MSNFIDNTVRERPSAPAKYLPADCPHEAFDAHVEIHRLAVQEGGPQNVFLAEVRIRCHDCSDNFQFPGLPAGVCSHEARTSADGEILLIPIKPSDKVAFEGFPGFTMRRTA